MHFSFLFLRFAGFFYLQLLFNIHYTFLDEVIELNKNREAVEKNVEKHPFDVTLGESVNK